METTKGRMGRRRKKKNKRIKGKMKKGKIKGKMRKKSKKERMECR